MAVSLDPETNTAKVTLTIENEVFTGSVQLTAEATEKPAPKAKKRSKYRLKYCLKTINMI